MKNLQAITNKNHKEEPSVAIISLNAEKTIKNALESVKNFKEIIVVDNGSTDKTIEIAHKYTKKIYRYEVKNFKKLREYALKKISNDWVFFIDTDEVITKENKTQLLKIWNEKKSVFDGFWIKRRNYFSNGKNDYLKHGLFYPDFQLRLFKKKYDYINNPHEVPNISLKKTFFCRSVEIFHYPHKEKLFSILGFLKLLPLVKIHAKNLTNQHFINLFLHALWRFFDLFFVSLIRGKGILDGYYGILAAFNFSVHISLIYLYAIILKLKKNH